jgi:hypothetical protein
VIGGQTVVGRLVIYRPYSRVAVVESVGGQRYLVRTYSRKATNLDAIGMPKKRKGVGHPGQKYKVTYPDGHSQIFNSATEVCKAFNHNGSAVAHLKRTKKADGHVIEKS